VGFKDDLKNFLLIRNVLPLCESGVVSDDEVIRNLYRAMRDVWPQINPATEMSSRNYSGKFYPVPLVLGLPQTKRTIALPRDTLLAFVARRLLWLPWIQARAWLRRVGYEQHEDVYNPLVELPIESAGVVFRGTVSCSKTVVIRGAYDSYNDVFYIMDAYADDYVFAPLK
jgi:hypothetical protein